MEELSRIASAIQASTTMAIDTMFKQMKADGIGVIGFGAGESDSNTPNNVRAVGIATIEQNVTCYTPAADTVELRQTVCGRMKADYRLEYKPSQVAMSSGAKHLVYLALRAVINPGNEVTLPASYWMNYIEFIKMAGGVPVVVTVAETEHFKLTTEKLPVAITPGAEATLFNNPSNSTGVMYDREGLEAIATVYTQTDIYVTSGEIYAYLAYDGRIFIGFVLLNADAKERTILVSSVSKAHAAADWRIGYICANDAITKVMTNYVNHFTSSPVAISQKVAVVTPSDS